MARCHSYYQNISPNGAPLGVPVRCTIDTEGLPGHQNHRNGAGGRAVYWHTRAQMVHPWTPLLKLGLRGEYPDED